MKYRREIDGLRAVAVIPVILFHAGFESFKGGFVGVDVFFVISGYLITTIILSEKERGTFSLINFYERRIRRILPALFFVMIAAWPFAWLWLLPEDMVSFSQSLIAVSTFSSNLLFWRTSGYWGLENELVPLLHTWSLAVEEQYYLLFPLFLMLMWRFRRRWIFTSFLLLAGCSLLLSQWAAYQYPTANFFLLVTRAWELAIGAGIAFFFLYRQQAVNALRSHQFIAELFSIAGLSMIVLSVLMFDETVPFPGFYALIPTVGTGLIVLCASPQTVVGRFLGLQVFVSIGLISYSAYLWHMPLFAFARQRSLTTPDATLFLSLSALSIVLAFLSWNYVERPFREKGRMSRRTIFSLTALGSFAFIAIGLAGILKSGWPDRFDLELRETINAATLEIPGDKLCLKDAGLTAIDKSICTLLENDGKSALLMGDSHAIAIAAELRNAFRESKLGLIQATERGCPPVRDVYVYVSEADRSRCFDHNESVYRFLETSPDIEVVILVARWSLYSKGLRFDNQEGGVEPHETLYFDGVATDVADTNSEYDPTVYFEQAYENSVRELLAMDKTVILVYPIPEVGWNVPRYIKNTYLNGENNALSPSTGSTSYSVFRDRNAGSYRALDRIGEHENLLRIHPAATLCNTVSENRCVVQSNRQLLYRDDDHLSNAGARLLSELIMGHLD